MTHINVTFEESNQRIATGFGISDQMFKIGFGQTYSIDGYEEGYSHGYADGCIDTDENIAILLKTI